MNFSSVVKFASQFVSKSFYQREFAEMVVKTNKDVLQGNARPLFKAMALVGFTGYAMEYSCVGSKNTFFLSAHCCYF